MYLISKTVLVVCLSLTEAIRETCALSKSQADGTTSSKAKILQTHYAEDANNLTELNAHMKHIGHLSKWMNLFLKQGDIRLPINSI